MTNTKQLPNTTLSYWERETFFRDIDLLVVGSGIVGLTAAIRLRELTPDRRVVILERGSLPMGASTRNAGFACFGSLSELLDDEQQRSRTEVLDLAAERYRGLIRLRERLGDAAIGYLPYGGYELFRAAESDRYRACCDALESFNVSLREITGRPDTYRLADDQIAAFGFSGVQHLIHNQAEGQIHTGKMMRALLNKALAAGVEIFNGIEVSSLEDQAGAVHLITAQGWEITARQVLVATNGFVPKLLPQLAVKPARNQVLITQPIAGLPFGACFHYDRGYYYFRNIDNRVLLGGGRNLDPEGETTDAFGTTDRIRSALLDLLHHTILPGRPVAIDTWWSGIMGIGPQKQPILEKLSERLAVAVRLGGMGVAIGSLVGERGAALLLDTD